MTHRWVKIGNDMEGLALNVQPYPEEVLDLPPGQVRVKAFVPDHYHVVMGASGKMEREVNVGAMEREGIPLYKRRGGGGTCLLGPETVVITVHAGVRSLYNNRGYFRVINDALIQVLRDFVPQGTPFVQAGLSDIAVDYRKIVGSSLFRRRGALLYQASVLMDLDLDRMNQLLLHPPREPDYREGRDHAAFLSCLRVLGMTRDAVELVEACGSRLPPLIEALLAQVDGVVPA